jgi:mediator of RNA polymerase II transcription subunit 16
MPLMMDEDMDMDDLFGDGAGLSLPSRPPTKELYQRIDDMRGSGCCQLVCFGTFWNTADTDQGYCLVEMG